MSAKSMNIGDTVRLVDEPGEGTITAIDGTTCIVEIDGFELPYESNQLVKVEHDGLIKREVTETDISAKDKLRRIEGRSKLQNLAPSTPAVYELDLHIHELLDRFDNMSNGEILSYQMGRCKAFISEAVNKRFPKVVLIHGVGEGVLRTEIHRFLDQLDHVEYHDAPYRTYGYGATEVLIRR